MRTWIASLASLALAACTAPSPRRDVGQQRAALTGSYSANVSWSGGTCSICGQAGYVCGLGGALASFTDSTPADSLVTSVTVDLSGTTCGATTTLSALINGLTIGTTSTSLNCGCDICDPLHSFTLTDDNGLSGWVYQGANGLTWSDNDSFCASHATVTVGWKSKSTTALATSASPSVFGQAVTYTATVSGAGGTPTGSVRFTDGGGLIGTVALDGTGVAKLTVTPGLGSHAIAAAYAGDAGHAGSTAGLTQVVNKASTSTSLGSSANPSTVGQGVSLTATVSVLAPGAATPSGMVQFSDGATAIGSAALGAGGQATIVVSNLAVGTHALSAAYAGDADVAASSSAAMSQVVSQDAPTLTLGATPNPSTLGGAVTLSASVAPAVGASGVPTGNVSFSDGATALGTVALDGSGKATLSTSQLLAGSHTLGAVYAGDANHQGVSGSIGHTVDPGPTTTALASATNPSVAGQAVSLTATVSGALVTPTGTVRFFDGASALGSATLNGAGQAILSTSAIAVGARTLSAQYGGDANHLGSTSGNLAQQVGQAATTTALSSSSNPSLSGASITLSAAVSVVAPGAGTPTGSVTFYDDATALGSAALDGSGVARLDTSALTVGTHTLSARFGGEARFSASTSTGLSQTVAQDGVTATLQASPNPSRLGDSVRFTAHVVASGPSGAPTGSVSFKEGATLLGSAALDGAGLAQLTIDTLAIGSHTVSAAYGGDATHTGGATSSVVQIVRARATSTALTSAPSPSVTRQAVSFTATVSAAVGTPSGEVSFAEGATALGTAPLVGGVATLTTSALLAGTHPVVASYGGDASYAPSVSATDNHVVGPAGTTTALASSANPAFAGASVTFTATVSAAAPGAGVPTGQVVFSDGATSLGAGTLSGAGVTSFSISTLEIGAHAIIARYAGDGDYASSDSTAIDQAVKNGGVSATLDATPPMTSFGSSVILSVTVLASNGTTSGEVRFSEGPSALGSATLDGDGAARLALDRLAVGNHTITARYEGDATHGTALAQTAVTIVKAATATALSAAPNPAAVGEVVTLSAQVTAAVAGVAGVVQFLDGSTSLGTAPVVGDTALITVAQLAEGDHVITAVYAGNEHFVGSTAAAAAVKITPPTSGADAGDGGGGDDGGCAIGGGSSDARWALLALLVFVRRRRAG